MTIPDNLDSDHNTSLNLNWEPGLFHFLSAKKVSSVTNTDISPEIIQIAK